MSKAFVKEDLNQSEEDLEAAPSLPAGFKNYMTRGGYAKLKAELHTLLSQTRPDVVRTVSWAASNGDRSENGDYLYGKKRLREIDRRIRFLQKRIESAEVVDLENLRKDRIVFGSRFRIRRFIDTPKERTLEYQIVGIDEADPKLGLISWISPLAKAVLGKTAGESFGFRLTSHELEECEIVEIL
jgi:transcription elongation factor GreB